MKFDRVTDCDECIRRQRRAEYILKTEHLINTKTPEEIEKFKIDKNAAINKSTKFYRAVVKDEVYGWRVMKYYEGPKFPPFVGGICDSCERDTKTYDYLEEFDKGEALAAFVMED